MNDEQLRAATIDKDALVLAAAGTGKTAVIIERINYLLEVEKVKPESILAITFTKKAAVEMEAAEKVKNLSYKKYDKFFLAKRILAITCRIVLVQTKKREIVLC